ncbi:MAG: lysophospholipase [Aquabacterium sp.]|uniref:alpha/beta hydrolase n=1 Tax=Aquabacterium sp. TaxID=1872578 RepID=UPI0025C0CCA9|nr:alpha/beta hydrolase [Aquabacterium sp.]MBI3383555.1 lysophospholipase [Aquabacterium sp.]
MSHKLLPSSIHARDGLTLHLSHWPVTTPKGVVVFLHGLTEHGQRYKELGQRLNALGWSVLAPDMRGHGLSGGPRGGMSRDDDFLHDLAAVIDVARSTYPQGPLVLFGHSTGGALATRFAAAQALPREDVAWARPIDGLMLSVPALQPTMSLVQKALLSTMGRLIQDVAVPVAFKPEWSSSDPAVIAEFNHDPLTHTKITPRVALFLAGLAPVVMRRAPSWTIRTLMLYTPDDRLVVPQGCERFMAAMPADLATTRAFPGLLHDMLREPDRARVHLAV